ncbi:MAG: sugar phosphate nucleotidyltransferase [Gemmatimonadales bacterium]
MLDTAVIPCGGLGTRLQPITRWLPKELLPVGLRPVLCWTLDEIADAGLLRAILITSPLKPALETAARTYQGPLELEFVAQQRPRGLGDAFLHARDLLEGAPFAAILPEFLFRGPNPTRAVVDVHRDGGLAAALVAAPNGPFPPGRSGARPATVREAGEGLQVTDVAVDAEPLNGGGRPARLLGRFVFPGDVFAELEATAREAPAGTEVDGLAVLRGLARRGQLAGARSEAAWYEVGLPDGYRSAVADFPARA